MATNSLPSINALFNESWERFKGSLLNLFILTIITIGIFIGIFIVGLLITLPLGALSIFSAISSQSFNPAVFSSLGILGLIIFLLIVLSVIVGLAIQAATIMIVANYKSAPSVPATIKHGFKFALPLFLASLLMGFIVTGGYILFIIPGIFFQVLLYFMAYEIVLNKMSVLKAARRSIGIVMSNFWGVLGRVLLWIVIVLAISIIPNIIISSTRSEALISLWSVINMFINVAVSWFGISYIVTLYMQAEKATPENKIGKLLWPVVTAIVGWVLGIIMFATIMWFIFSILIPNIQYAAKSKEFQETLKQLEKGNEVDPNVILNALPTNSPQRAEILKEINKQMMMQKNNGMMEN